MPKPAISRVRPLTPEECRLAEVRQDQVGFATALWWRILRESMRRRDQQDGDSHEQWQK